MEKNLSYYTNLLKEQASSLSVLYVEDDDDVRNGIANLLKKFFNDITLAVDGQDGLEKFQSGSYDLILTDLSMPRLNGVQMSTKIKSINYEQAIVVISAHNEGEYLIDLINCGVDAFLLKPIQTENLVKVLSKVCGHLSDAKLLEEYQEKMEISYIDLMNQKDELQRQINAKIDTENKNIVFEENLKENKELSSSEVKFLTKDFDAISAVEFIENYPTDILIYSDKLLELSESIDVLINQFSKSNSKDDAVSLSESFSLYADILQNIPEFVNLTYAINQLSEVFKNHDTSVDQNDFIDLTLAISQELEKWRESIFENQDADNIHYLDKSLISDCVMLESLVVGSSGDSEDDLDDMFF